jgi:uncharacterized protein YyaL (SSP411 family)
MRLLLLGLVSLAWIELGCAAAATRTHTPSARAASGVTWQPWSRETFERAAREKKHLLISVQTEWCHWCHVMNDETYQDATVSQLIAERFIAVRVDADQRPDVAERYQRWGWPATGLLTPNAEPIVNLRGYQAPKDFTRVLERASTQGPSAFENANAAAPSASTRQWSALRDAARAQLDEQWDEAQAGWGAPQKYPRAAPVEHGFFAAAIGGDAAREARVLRALKAYAKLIDPVWGGMYQYSVHGDWEHPHYEKIHAVQTGAIESFVEAFRATGDRSWLAHAQSIARYLTQHMQRADGGFYANQDADVGRPSDAFHESGAAFYARDANARDGVRAPGIDEHVYSNLNGMSITALCKLYEATMDESYLEAAERAFSVVERDRRKGAGYAHDQAGSAVEYFTDDLELARALFALHEVTGDAKSGARLLELVRHTLATFEDKERGGFFAHTQDPEAIGALARAPKSASDNARFARLLLWLSRRDAESESGRALQSTAERTQRALGDEDALRDQGRDIGDYLVAVEDLIVTIVGDIDDERAIALQRAALTQYAPNRRVLAVSAEEAHYPYPGEPAAYMCSSDSCSLPVTEPAKIASTLRNALQPMAATR